MSYVFSNFGKIPFVNVVIDLVHQVKHVTTVEEHGLNELVPDISSKRISGVPSSHVIELRDVHNRVITSLVYDGSLMQDKSTGNSSEEGVNV